MAITEVTKSDLHFLHKEVGAVKHYAGGAGAPSLAKLCHLTRISGPWISLVTPSEEAGPGLPSGCLGSRLAGEREGGFTIMTPSPTLQAPLHIPFMFIYKKIVVK